MARTTQITDRPRRLQDLNAMLVSALCHLAVLIGLGLVMAASEEAWPGVKLMAHVGDGVESTPLDDTLLADTVELHVAADAPAAVGPARLFDDVALATTDMAALDALSEYAAIASGFEGLALGGTGEEDGSTSLASTEFFGIGGYGQSFVYVVDCSGSMNDRGKFDRARYELMQSIEQLSSDQQFFVIFFNHGAIAMDAVGLVPASEEHIARTAQWVNHFEPHGGTAPLPALLMALSMRPDAIYFLSDGKFDLSTLSELRRRNGPRSRRVPIHAIAFVDRSTQGLMRTIARDSGGQYRFVQ